MVEEHNMVCSWPFTEIAGLINLLINEDDDLHVHEDFVDFEGTINNIAAAGHAQDVYYWSPKLRCCRIYKRYEPEL